MITSHVSCDQGN